MTAPLRVLILEDSETDAKLIILELRRIGRELHCVRLETEDGLRAALAESTWDVILSDWSMPGLSAPRALAILKETGLDVPFLIVSGTVGEETAVEAMRAGAHDYVLKHSLARLAPAIEREIRENTLRRERLESDRRLRASEARFAKLFDSGLVGIAIADRAGHLTDANDAYLHMLGFAREELAAIRWQEMTPPEWRESDERAAEVLRARGVVPLREKESFRKDGSRVPILIGLAQLDERSCLLFAADLTERKRAEEALRRSEEQLRQSQKMEAVGSLAGGVAHDFNNLLSVILSYASLLIDDVESDSPMREDLEEIRRAAVRAAELTRQLLLFSRQQVAEPRVLDLNEVLAGMDKMLHRIVGEDVRVEIEKAAGLASVKVDRSHLEQVVMNLVVNARDAMPTGGKLLISTSNVFFGPEGMPRGAYVLLTVSDTGHGIDEATKARIFEPFFTTKEKGKGTGLGLSTVFGIIQQCNGAITVESAPGEGTRFQIYLPACEESLDSKTQIGAPSGLRGDETVLLVEDHEQVRAACLGILRRQGYNVLEASNAGEALLLCEGTDKRIDLLLTDVVMPHMSGPDLARRLLRAKPGMKVLCVSGYTDDTILRHGMSGARIAFLQKPFTPESLARKVREVLDAAD